MPLSLEMGLHVNMRSLPWYVRANPDSFFPRCYSLCTDSEQQEFLDDFRRTMASSILEWVVSHQSCGRSKPRAQTEEAENSELSSSTRVWGVGQGPGSAGPPELGSSTGALLPPGHDAENAEAKLRGLPGQLVDIECKVCQTYLGKLEHEDIDMAEGTTEDLTQQYFSLLSLSSPHRSLSPPATTTTG
ncbi:Protein monoglycylase ttll8, partial [Saguinus oedipus]